MTERLKSWLVFGLLAGTAAYGGMPRMPGSGYAMPMRDGEENDHPPQAPRLRPAVETQGISGGLRSCSW
jgi:hypothetical protein